MTKKNETKADFMPDDPRVAQAERIIEREISRNNTHAIILPNKSLEFVKNMDLYDRRNVPQEVAAKALLLTSDRDKVIKALIVSITLGDEYR